MPSDIGTLLPDQYELVHDEGSAKWYLYNPSFCMAVQVLNPPAGAQWELEFDEDF
jgi:hypothetical protein